MEINVNAYAKLNISLDVISKMENGYHEMKMVMQSVSLCDDIKIACAEGSGKIHMKTNRNYLPNDDRNIAVKAARVFCEETGISGYDISIDILKRIPVCAGLGGGSSDAAAVLRAMNTLFDTKLTARRLEVMGEKLGSDVPYCVAGGTVLAQGRGEILSDLPALPECSVVICKPAFSISTPELFSRIKCDKIKCRPDTEGLLKALETGDLKDAARRTYNVFEDVLVQGAEEIAMIKNTLYDYRAIGAAMSGTGSAVFGLFENEADAKEAYNVLKSKYKECFLTKTIGKIEI